MVKGWNEVSIAQYKKILAIKEDEDWVWNFLAIVEKTTYEDIVTRPLKETAALSSEALKWAKNPPKRHLVKTKYEINGKKYDLKASPNDITTAQYIDFYNAPKDIPDRLEEMLAIFLVPEGKNYNEGYDLEQVKMDINFHLSIEDALSVCDFFTALHQVLVRRAIRRAKRALRKARRDGVQTDQAENLLKRFQCIAGLK